MDRKPRVFIGSSSEASTFAQHFYTVLSERDFEPVSWHYGFEAGKSYLSGLVEADPFDFAVLLITADDKSVSRGETRPAPRDNIWFEAGFFIGRLGPERVFLLVAKSVRHDIKIPSDLAGIRMLYYDDQRNLTELTNSFIPAVNELWTRYLAIGLAKSSMVDHNPSRPSTSSSSKREISASHRAQSSQTEGFSAATLHEAIAAILADDDFPIAIVVGGSAKYDDDRRLAWGMKEYQSTQPVTGVVRCAIALNDLKAGAFEGAYPDHDPFLHSGMRDLIVVGGGDTNLIANTIQRVHGTELDVRFNASNSSDTIVDQSGRSLKSSPTDGFIVAMLRPELADLGISTRYVLWCAGNGAKGTNRSLDFLRDMLVNGEPEQVDGNHTRVVL